jgi:hypothetical protein
MLDEKADDGTCIMISKNRTGRDMHGKIGVSVLLHLVALPDYIYLFASPNATCLISMPIYAVDPQCSSP